MREVAIKPVPEATKDRLTWLKELRPGDLVYYSNGGYRPRPDPIHLVVKVTSDVVFTRSIDDFIFGRSINGMKRGLISHQNIMTEWCIETGIALDKNRTHNFIHPTFDCSLDTWLKKEEEGTLPGCYKPPNLKVLDSFRAWLRAGKFDT
jgi:hypothetical protein